MSLDLSTLNIATAFAIDEDKAENGTWFPLTKEISVKLRRFKSVVSQKARTEFMKPYIGLTRRGQELPDATSLEILIKQMAKGVIVDWKGVKAGDNELPCTYDNKVELLTALPELRDTIFSLAIEIETFKPEQDEEGLKN
jgi:hypothetical protein